MPSNLEDTLAISKCNLDLALNSGSTSSGRALQSIAGSNIVIAESLIKMNKKLEEIGLTLMVK